MVKFRGLLRIRRPFWFEEGRRSRRIRRRNGINSSSSIGGIIKRWEKFAGNRSSVKIVREEEEEEEERTTSTSSRKSRKKKRGKENKK
ncbi:hypothetical protein M0804_000058 [Polistes exclamans]|nr:hypothetical protein M0804_000058 [Polistes exclamans]